MVHFTYYHLEDYYTHIYTHQPQYTHTHTFVLLVGPRALEQLVSLERLTYVAYFVLVTCFLVFVQN